MKRNILIILILALVPITVKAASLGQLLANSDSFDKQEVVVSGEVVGEVLKTDGGFWINLASGGHNLGIFSQSRQAFGSISHWGSYAETGDNLEIAGIFYKQCFQHHTSDIHLNKVKVLKPGHKIEPKVSARKVRIANLGLIISLLMVLVYFLKEKYGTRA